MPGRIRPGRSSRVVGEAPSGKAAMERVDALKSDLVIMDIRMPEMDGIVATRKITARHSDARILILTAYDDPEYVEAAMGAGAMGCMSKRRAHSELVGALDILASGRMTFPAHAVNLLAKTRNPARVPSRGWESTNDQEREILYLTAAGYTAEEIARKIHLAPKTVANYRIALKDKLDMRTRADVMRIVVESGHLPDMLKAAGLEGVS